MNYGIEVLKEILKVRNPVQKIISPDKRHYNDSIKSPPHYRHYSRPTASSSAYDNYHHYDYKSDNKPKYHPRRVNKYDE